MKKIPNSLRRWAYLAWLPFRNPVVPHDGTQFVNIGEGTFEHGQKTFYPDAATTSRYLLYKIGAGVNGPAANSCTLTTAATDYPLGSSDDQADLAYVGQGIAIKLFGVQKGTVRVISDGTIINGSRVGPSGATNGYATVATTGNSSFGIALIPADTVVAAGQPVEVITSLPAKYSF